MNLNTALAHPELNPWECSRRGRILETFEIDSWELEMTRNLVENCTAAREDHYQYLVAAHANYIAALRSIRQQTKKAPLPSLVDKIKAIETEKAAVAKKFQSDIQIERNKMTLSSSERRMLAKAQQKKSGLEKFRESKICPYIKAGIEVGVMTACARTGSRKVVAACTVGIGGGLDAMCKSKPANVSSVSTPDDGGGES